MESIDRRLITASRVETGIGPAYNETAMTEGIRWSGFERLVPSLTGLRRRFTADGLIGRIWRRDHTVWKDRDEEISDRLGWLEAPSKALEDLAAYESFAREVREDGFTAVLLLGMGGSSLAPEVFSRVFGPAPGYPTLDVLDTTDPAAVLSLARRLPAGRTLFIVSSKSGTTLETTSLLNYFFDRTAGLLGRVRAGRAFVAVTDPGSFLESEAGRLGFRRIFSGDPDIGGRFSALSPFGLVPASLLGCDLHGLVRSAMEAARLCRDEDIIRNPGAEFGLALGALALAGRDKAVFSLSPRIDCLGAWIEQLVAESTGKDGRGILPVVRATGAPDPGPAPDRFRIRLRLEDDSADGFAFPPPEEGGEPAVWLTLGSPLDLGAQFFLWEFATAVAGAVLGINPFDQPNVALSKKKTEAALRAVRQKGSFPGERPSWTDGRVSFFGPETAANLEAGIRRFLDDLDPRGYVSIQAFLPPHAAVSAALRTLARAIEIRTGRPVTHDFGPRFLHSTGQLHKGDGGLGLFLQMTADHAEDAGVPPAPEGGAPEFTFGRLIDAQALGDREALRDKGRRVARIHFLGACADGLDHLASELA